MLTVLVFWSLFLLLPRLPPWSRNLRLFPGLAFCCTGPRRLLGSAARSSPHHPLKNGTHSTCFYSTGGHTPVLGSSRETPRTQARTCSSDREVPEKLDGLCFVSESSSCCCCCCHGCPHSACPASASFTWRPFRPRKKIFSPPPPIPPNSLQTPSRPPRPLPPPPGIFNKKNRPPPSLSPRTPLPLPGAEKNKKYPKRPPSSSRC